MARVVQTDGHLRSLLRTARSQSGLTQEQAAQRASVTQGWWKQVENGHANVGEDTLAAMLAVAGVSPGRLADEGYKHLAGLVATWLDIERDTQASLEDYLADAPASEAVREALIAYARTLNQVQVKPGRRQHEPFAVQFMPPQSARQRRQGAKGNGQHNDKHGP